MARSFKPSGTSISKPLVLKTGSSVTGLIDGGEVTVIRVGKRETVGKVRLTTDQVNALPDAADELVTAVAAHAPELVEAFALPEALLADWPIAGAGYADVYDDPCAPWHTGKEAVPVGGAR